MKSSKLFLVLLGIVLNLVGRVQAQDTPPVISDAPDYIGVPRPYGSMSSDPFWWSHRDTFYNLVMYDTSNFTNVAGAPSFFFYPGGTSRRSDLFFYADNHYDLNGNPVPHKLNFWYKGIWSGSGTQFTVNRGNSQFFPIIGFNNSSAVWTKATYTMPAIADPTFTVLFLFQVGSNDRSYPSAWIDAVQFIPVYPPTTNSYTTNLVARLTTTNTIAVSWGSAVGSGCVLEGANQPTGPWGTFLPGVVSYSTNSGLVYGVVTNHHIGSKFFRLSR